MSQREPSPSLAIADVLKRLIETAATFRVAPEMMAALQLELHHARSAPAPQSVASVMLEKMRERRKRALEGVQPTRGECEKVMTDWTTQSVLQEHAPTGSAMRAVLDAGDAIISRLWRLASNLEERLVDAPSPQP